jgi:hypothetical protein
MGRNFYPTGKTSARPTGISASPAGKGWRSGRIDWEADAQLTADLTGLRRLVDELDQPYGGPSGLPPNRHRFAVQSATGAESRSARLLNFYSDEGFTLRAVGTTR